MPISFIIRGFIVIMLLLIVGSLFFALASMYKGQGKGQGTRTVKFLTVRIVLSLLLFFLLMAGFYLGLLTPHGLRQ